MLRAAAQKRHDLRGTKKTMPVNEPDDFAVAFRQSHGSNCGGAFEAVKAGFHPATLTEMQETEET
jgi:hypothetical protein